MNKKEFLAKLKALIREIECMNQGVFEERFATGTLDFDHLDWRDPIKVVTSISMKKIPLTDKLAPGWTRDCKFTPVE